VTRRLTAALIALIACLALVGCGSDGGTAKSSSSTSTTASTPGTTGAPVDGDLPPKDSADFAALYDGELATIGLRLTPRGGLIDRSNNGYEHSATGTHLALYVEPLANRSTKQYIAGILDVATIFAGDIFTRWPGLQSFDVCQEPTTAVDARPEPVAVTQIEMSREQATSFEWKTVTIVDLLAAAKAKPPRMEINVSSLISGDGDFQRLSSEADQQNAAN
jgi:hypothetical protein